jgi:hypothetical protein
VQRSRESDEPARDHGPDASVAAGKSDGDCAGDERGGEQLGRPAGLLRLGLPERQPQCVRGRGVAHVSLHS